MTDTLFTYIKNTFLNKTITVVLLGGAGENSKAYVGKVEAVGQDFVVLNERNKKYVIPFSSIAYIE